MWSWRLWHLLAFLSVVVPIWYGVGIKMNFLIKKGLTRSKLRYIIMLRKE
jgi:hypothetical protein